MNRIMPALSLVFLLIISGCSSSSDAFTFTGESDNWTAELKVTQTTDDNEKQHMTLQYKGENAKNMEEFSYTVETNAGGFSAGDVVLGENGVYEDTAEANTTNAKVNKNSEVKVIVEWDNHTENMILKKE
ncbi:hypothetical protein ABER68_21155 [Paenibacillus alvei]